MDPNVLCWTNSGLCLLWYVPTTSTEGFSKRCTFEKTHIFTEMWQPTHNSRCIGVAIDTEPTLQPPFHSLQPMCAAANPQWDLVSNKCWRLWGGEEEETSFFSVIFLLAMCGDGSVHNLIRGKWKVVVAQNWIAMGCLNGDQHHKVLAIAYFYESSHPVLCFQIWWRKDGELLPRQSARLRQMAPTGAQSRRGRYSLRIRYQLTMSFTC